MTHLTIYITYGNEENALEVSRALLEQKLVACANIFPPIRSLYHWDGALQDEPEIAVLYKTTAENYDALEKNVKALHSYDEPCIVAYPIEKGSAGFLEWISAQTTGGVQ